jgi:hypothetical protein
MGAAGYGTLTHHFTDRTVVTYDPHGSERSKRTDGAMHNTSRSTRNDLHRLIAAIDAGPVNLFAQQRRHGERAGPSRRAPEQVRTLIGTGPSSIS